MALFVNKLPPTMSVAFQKSGQRLLAMSSVVVFPEVQLLGSNFILLLLSHVLFDKRPQRRGSKRAIGL